MRAALTNRINQWRQRFYQSGAWWWWHRLRWYCGLSAAERYRVGLHVSRKTVTHYDRRTQP